MKLIEDWEEPRIEFLGIVAREGKRGQSVHLSTTEMNALRRALTILEQLRIAADPNKNFDYGDGTNEVERITSAEAYLWELLDAHPDGQFRVDLEKLREYGEGKSDDSTVSTLDK